MGKAIVRFETRDTVVEKSCEIAGLIDEALLIDAILNCIAAQLSICSGHFDFKFHFMNKFKAKFGEL